MRVLVTGGCGYVGTMLTGRLLQRGDRVTVLDALWFGNELGEHPGLTVLEADMRAVDQVDVAGFDVVVHLANIANDPCAELNPHLSWEVNALATMRLVEACARAGVRQFIYASSGSVYGVKREERVTEDLPLTPISEYNKTKMVAERVVLSYAKDLTVQILRPATVCGYSPRMRLDLTVNMLTMQALTRKRITVFGGDQTRPNVHIHDMVGAYTHLIDAGERIQGVFNVGFENLTVMSIARLVAERIPAEIVVTPSNDPRSYLIDSGRFLRTGFAPSKRVSDAITDLMEAHSTGRLKDEDRWYNVRWMKQLKLG